MSWGRLPPNASMSTSVAPSAFVPPPKVTSTVARLTPRPSGQRLKDLAPLEQLTAAAFGQRRKMLRGSLAGVFADPVAVLEGLGLSPTARAEPQPCGAGYDKRVTDVVGARSC